MFRPVQLFLGSCLFEGRASVFRRKFEGVQYELMVMITVCSTFFHFLRIQCLQRVGLSEKKEVFELGMAG